MQPASSGWTLFVLYRPDCRCGDRRRDTGDCAAPVLIHAIAHIDNRIIFWSVAINKKSSLEGQINLFAGDTGFVIFGLVRGTKESARQGF
jgi:hypothetical protein